MASAAWRNTDGVPVLVIVAAIFWPMIPDFPIPVKMTRPLHERSSSTAHENFPSSRSSRARIAAASVSSTRRASERSATRRRLAVVAIAIDASRFGRTAAADRVDRRQAPQQRGEPIESQRVLRVALRARRFLVHLEEHAVDACRHAGRRQWLDELRLA